MNDTAPAQTMQVFRADCLRVIYGANMGDGMGIADDLVADDIYALAPAASRSRLTLRFGKAPHFIVGAQSETGTPGAQIHLDCCVTFMNRDGQTTEVLVLAEVDDNGDLADIFLLPLAPLKPDVEYVLVGVDARNPRRKFAQVACVSFARGTRITLASGAQKQIEDLAVGDKVLTRDDGAQKIRWIGQTTVRAVGEFSPILITAGTLHNEADLMVSPDHRLFIYQRTDRLGAGRSEVLVKARHLINGQSVYRLDGGFVDYFQLLFDDHQIIYAEGIAAESLLIDTRTRPVLPRELSRKLAAHLPGHQNRLLLDFEVTETLLDHPDAADMLRRASRG